MNRAKGASNHQNERPANTRHSSTSPIAINTNRTTPTFLKRSICRAVSARLSSMRREYSARGSKTGGWLELLVGMASASSMRFHKYALNRSLIVADAEVFTERHNLSRERRSQ